MSELSTVRGLQPELDAAGINTILLNIHEAPGSDLLERFGFQATPTFVVYSADGREMLRTNRAPSLENIISAANGQGS